MLPKQSATERKKEEIPVSTAVSPKKSHPSEVSKSQATTRSTSLVAIIIDDLGNSLEIAKPFLDFPHPIALSILPKLRYSESIARMAEERGRTTLLHLPVEAKAENYFLGPGALITTMSEKAMERTLEQDLKTVPGVQGINNHLGSKGTTDPKITRMIALEAKHHHLFVVDSLTTPNSILYDEARESGVPAERREIFLDNDVNEKAIKGKIDDLIKAAKVKGKAIAIGHPHLITLKVIQQSIPRLEKENIKLVPLGRLMKD